jgi:hypothetical protein
MQLKIIGSKLTFGGRGARYLTRFHVRSKRARYDRVNLKLGGLLI